MSDFFFQESTPVPGRRHEARDGATVGRGEADIVLVDPQVSRVHAKLHVGAFEVSVEDLESRNGTFVNEVRVTEETRLREGDTLRMGDTVWRLFADVPVAAAAAPGEAPAAAPAGAPAPAPSALGTAVRGDVPPPDPKPSGVYAAPAPDPAAPPSFSEPRTRPARRQRGSAARSARATLLSYAVVLATAIAVVLYLALR